MKHFIWYLCEESVNYTLEKISCKFYVAVFSLVDSSINKTFFFSPQQDVSEFTHKLLDWLEDAFQMKAEEER